MRFAFSRLLKFRVSIKKKRLNLSKKSVISAKPSWVSNSSGEFMPLFADGEDKDLEIPAKVGILEKFNDVLVGIRTFSINLLVVPLLVASACFIIIYMYKDLTTRLVIIEPLEVPEEYATKGLTGRVMAKKLQDKIEAITSAQKSEYKPDKFLTANSLTNIDIEVPGSGVSLDVISKLIRKFYNLEPTKITGEIFKINNIDYVTMRVTGEPAITLAINDRNMDSTLHISSKYVLKYIDPYKLLIYQRAQKEDYSGLLSYMLTNKIKEDDADAHFARGLDLDNAGKEYDAVESYRQAYFLNPNNSTLLSNWAASLNGLGNYNEAIQKCKQALSIDPINDDAYLNWGNALLGLKRDEDALEKFKKALTIDQNTNLQLQYGNALSRLGKTRAARAVYISAANSYKKRLKWLPGTSEMYHDYGRIIHALSNLENENNPKQKQQYQEMAMKLYVLAIRADAKNHNFYQALGDLYSEMNNKVEAEYAYDKLMKLDSNNIVSIYNFGIYLFSQQKYSQALKTFKEYIKKVEDPNGYIRIADCLFRLDKDAEAMLNYKKALALNPNSYDCYFGIGQCHYFLNQYSMAVDSYEKALKLEPENFYCILELGNSLDKIGKPSKAEVQFEKALEISKREIDVHPNSFEPYFMAGLALFHLKLDSDAIKMFAKVSKLKPNEAQVYTYWGRSLCYLEKYHEAIGKFKLAIAIKPSTDAYENLAKAYDAVSMPTLAAKTRLKLKSFEQSRTIERGAR